MHVLVLKHSREIIPKVFSRLIMPRDILMLNIQRTIVFAYLLCHVICLLYVTGTESTMQDASLPANDGDNSYQPPEPIGLEKDVDYPFDRITHNRPVQPEVQNRQLPGYPMEAVEMNKDENYDTNIYNSQKAINEQGPASAGDQQNSQKAINEQGPAFAGDQQNSQNAINEQRQAVAGDQQGVSSQIPVVSKPDVNN